ncbi:DUF4869 domain-containing protein [Agathobacter sp.]|uniref:DUF4869 domain-containing protein n=1 Tax=Agathobacter sp. TaxID=2021311 RepID=UPI003FD7CAF9
MLSITFRKSDNVLIYVDNFFDMNYEDEWLDDPFVQKMILDVDKSKLLTHSAIESHVLGIISPTKLSGGVKALILMLKGCDRIVWATACGGGI